MRSSPDDKINYEEMNERSEESERGQVKIETEIEVIQYKIEEEYDDKNLSDYADYDDDDSDGEEESGRRNMLGGEWIPGQGSVQSPRYSIGGRSRGRPVGGRRGGRR